MQHKLIITITLVALSIVFYSLGYFIGHGVMLHDCREIVSSKIAVPAPIIYLTEGK